MSRSPAPPPPMAPQPQDWRQAAEHEPTTRGGLRTPAPQQQGWHGQQPAGPQEVFLSAQGPASDPRLQEHYQSQLSRYVNTAPPRPQEQAARYEPQAQAPPQMPGHGSGAYRQQAQPDPRAGHDQWGRTGDPANYDLGSYAVGAASGAHPGQWQDDAQAAHQGQYYQPQIDPGYHGQVPGANLPVDDQGYQHEEAEYEEEPPRRGRRWLVAAALVGSIAVGGGLAYAYKSYMTPKMATGKPPVIKSASEPAKTVPDNAGGKRFANTDNKFMNRLDGAASSAGGSVEGDGVRRIQTIPVRPDGSLGAPPQAPGIQALPPGATRQAVTVPGVAVVDGGFPQAGANPFAVTQPGQTTARPAAPTQQATQPPAPAQKPQVVAKAPPPAPTQSAQPTETGAAKAPPTVRQQVPKTATAAAATGTAPAGATATKSTNGYGAVLGSVRTQMDALRAFADLQQKYDVLKGKEPFVQESDQSARGLGVIYRIVVGPPGSREAANQLCTQLKAAGHKDCWALAY